MGYSPEGHKELDTTEHTCMHIYIYIYVYTYIKYIFGLYMCVCVSVCMYIYVLSHFSRVQLFATPWTVARQASLSLTISRSLPKFMLIASVMLSSHLIL